MYSYGTKYNENDYSSLLNILMKLVAEQLPLKFFIPAFPCKSCNTEAKVLGRLPDFAEVLAISALVKTLRKLESVYTKGVKLTILSDYHTFDQFIGVNEETYQAYHEALKKMVNEAGATDIIELISLSSFPEFQNVPGPDLCKKLRDEFGGSLVLENFENALKEDEEMLEKYKQLKKFMQFDQSHRLPGSQRANTTRSFIRGIARGMIAQGIALDNFLKKHITEMKCIRLSIHQHHPATGKFAIDMYKEHKCSGEILRTPWHHVAIFDTLTGEYLIDHKQTIGNNEVDGSTLVTVPYQGQPWLLLRIYLDKHVTAMLSALPSFEVTLFRARCGLVIQCQSATPNGIPSSVIKEETLNSLIKEFGLVVLRGFKKFETEEELIEFYKKRAKFGIIKWKFGFIHKVTPNKEIPGYVNSSGGLPIHFDLNAPPKYMQISQEEHAYEEFICREFLLYCKKIGNRDQGATMFVDARGVVLSLTGQKITEWKKTTIAYETDLNLKSEKNQRKLVQKTGMESYFGGIGNVYVYPLVLKCPWTGSDVLRWWQTWTMERHPKSEQHNWSQIRSSPSEMEQDIKELESEIEKVAFDERFSFEHAYEEGDQAYVNNYTMLHGRKAFEECRELWRLQAVPQSDNVPKYFKDNGF